MTDWLLAGYVVMVNVTYALLGHRFLYFLGVVAFFSFVFLGVRFVTTSFVCTGSGPIKWSAGLEEVKAFILSPLSSPRGCMELGVMAHGDSQEEAIKEIKKANRVHLLMLSEDKEEIPQPSSLQVSN